MPGTPSNFTTLQVLLSTIQVGGAGATMPPPAAEIARHVVDAYVAGEHARAADAQRQFALFPARWMHRGLAPTMKAAMRFIGIDLGDPYPPYAALDKDEVTALETYLKGTILRPARRRLCSPLNGFR